jgi:hypothetical protein
VRCASVSHEHEAGDVGHVLSGGRLNVGRVSRVGNTVRRPRLPGSDVVEALLLHLERVGFEGSPRFLGVDDEGRQVLTFVDGDVAERPAWFDDDELNARRLGEMCSWLRSLHEATAGFVPDADALPQRPLAIAGGVWTHGDPAYANSVYRDGQLVGLIDWEYAGPADALCDPAALLAMQVRGPRLGADDPERRLGAARRAFVSIVNGYGMTDADMSRLAQAASRVVEDTVDFWRARGGADGDLEQLEWRARWFAEHGAQLLP